MVDYKSLGLVNTKEMFARAINGGYAIPAFNFNNMEQLQAIIKASSDLKSPVILQVSKGARNYANATLLRYMAQGAVEYAKELGCKHPEIVLHLDHGDSFETCKSCIDYGFSSVMIDASSLPFEENIALTKKVVDYAHQFDVTVEAELGVLAGVEDEVSSAVSHYTKPEEVIEFSQRSGCDSLAISIGTSHGAYKFTPEQCTRDPKTGKLVPPPLAFDVLDAVMEKLPGFSTVLQAFLRSMSTRSIHSAESCPMPSVFQRSSFVKHPRALSAKSTLTLTHVWPSPLPCAVYCTTNPENLTRVSSVAPLATRWRRCTSTRSSTFWVQTTNWLSSTNHQQKCKNKTGSFLAFRLFVFRSLRFFFTSSIHGPSPAIGRGDDAREDRVYVSCPSPSCTSVGLPLPCNSDLQKTFSFHH